MPGVYTYCFSNKMSTMTPKVVMFSMEIGETSEVKEKDGGKLLIIYNFFINSQIQ